jgi:NCAIR mutase (PurE)-related protein
MNPDDLRKLLTSVSAGDTNIDDAMLSLRDLPFADLGFANVDHHRALRNGFPEVVFGQGKTADQVIAILREISSKGQTALATRVAPDVGAKLSNEIDNVHYHPLSGTALVQAHPPKPLSSKSICIVCAGTSDLPVAEEAAITAEAYGNPVERISDVGVAGLHRLLHHRETLEAAGVIIVIAGMEGALPSVIGGLVSRPIIAVPTSVGYGASFGGIAALLGMLNSCAAGVTVVNIDNGFGAAHAASLINREYAL